MRPRRPTWKRSATRSMRMAAWLSRRRPAWDTESSGTTSRRTGCETFEVSETSKVLRGHGHHLAVSVIARATPFQRGRAAQPVEDRQQRRQRPQTLRSPRAGKGAQRLREQAGFGLAGRGAEARPALDERCEGICTPLVSGDLQQRPPHLQPAAPAARAAGAAASALRALARASPSASWLRRPAPGPATRVDTATGTAPARPGRWPARGFNDGCGYGGRGGQRLGQQRRLIGWQIRRQRLQNFGSPPFIGDGTCGAQCLDEQHGLIGR